MIDHTFAILAYKESPYLQECVDSLKKQTLRSNIIICTSTPSSFLEKIANENNLELFTNPERNGIACDWNFALGQATTELVTLAHQDDIYHPQYLKEIKTATSLRKDVLIAFPNYDEIVETEGKIFIRKNSLNFFVKKTILRLFFKTKNCIIKNKKGLLAYGSPIGCPAVTFQKSNIGSFEFDKNFSINIDWKAWYDLAQKNGSFVWIRKTLVSHRIYAESETSNGLADNRRHQEDIKMFEKFWSPTISSLLYKLYSISYKNNTN